MVGRPGEGHSLDGMAALAADVPPRFTPDKLITQTHLVDWPMLAILVAGGLYLYGVHRMHARGDRWPPLRTWLFVVAGLGTIFIGTVSGLAAYDDTLFSAHMVQHMLLSMVAPIFLALGAPVTLALRTLPSRPRHWLMAVLHSHVARLVMNPLVGFGLFVVTPWALYFSGLYPLTLRNAVAHELLHVHLVLVGCVFFWPLVGLDPVPGRVPYPARALLMFLSMPMHAILGLSIMQDRTLIAGDWYRGLHLNWVDPLSDQQVGGGLLWASGDTVGLLMVFALMAQWVKASQREAVRIDRQLDRLEAQQAAAQEQANETDGSDRSANIETV
jgi:cytochrome c oxidase assembly factor CtaG